MTLKGKGLLVKQMHGFVDGLALDKAKQVEADMLEVANHLVPVDTGNLKASIETKTTDIKDGKMVAIFVELDKAPYAIYVELGTEASAKRPWPTPAQPYITPAVEESFNRNF